MKCTIPEISWHNREPVLSVHIQPVFEKYYRLATGGADCHVLIWQLMINDNGSVKIEALSDLTRHQRAVNSVRWSPNGQYLATADDDANIIIWQLKTDNIPLLEGETNDKEVWLAYKVMRGHKEDIYDLCWSPNGLKLLSGSIDNTAILWDFNKGKSEQIMTDHKGFVQGVAWDPKSIYMATISTDRVCRIYDTNGKHIKSRIQKGLLPVPEDHYLHNKDVKYFHDDTFKSFFRRLEFSPDGSILAVPSSRIEIEDCKQIMNATLLFAVDSWASPIAILPCGKQCSTVVRFSPILYELHEDGEEPVISLPFRMIFAVGADHDVILYDTQQTKPFAYFKDIHYTRLTDLTWSHDGLLLIASSTDGYCSLITFEPDELGRQYVKEETEMEESIMDISGCEELDKEEVPLETKPKKLSLLEQWAVKTPKKSEDNEKKDEEKDSATSKRKGDEKEVDRITSTPKRIKPIPVVENTDKKSEDKINVTPKRIKPIPVAGEKINPKPSPLLNFLKKPSKPEEKIKNSTAANLTLDESEARDAWKCEKTEKPCEAIVKDDDYTEEFSLHLDDTNSKTINDKCVQNGTSENCVQPNNSEKESQNISSANCDTQENIKKVDIKTDEEKVVTKRRVPLITLSSPKQKKK